MQLEQQPQTAGYDVFLSHSNLDDRLASDVKKLLEANQISVYAAPSSVPAGKWDSRNEEALQNSSSIWVLLTPNALRESTWMHHELGYFYGYHGKGGDQQGDNCRYLYTKGTDRPGLYGRFQGVRIESFEDPVLIAETIAREMGREFILHTDWIVEVGAQRPAHVTEHTDISHPVLVVNKRAYGPGTTEVMIWLMNINETIHNVSVLTAHPDVNVVAIEGCIVIVPTYPSPNPIKFKLRDREQRLEEMFEEMVDDFGRRFNIMPGPGAPEGKVPLLITYEARGGRALAAVFYYTMSHNAEGYPDIDIDPPVPLEWREEIISLPQPMQ